MLLTNKKAAKSKQTVMGKWHLLLPHETRPVCMVSCKRDPTYVHVLLISGLPAYTDSQNQNSCGNSAANPGRLGLEGKHGSS